MGGIFGVASKNSCTLDLFFGVDYHSHLGTKRGGMAVYGSQGFTRSIHNIENTPFRTKFDGDLDELEGTLGIGCISDNEPQPLLIQSHLGSFAITTVGKINNEAELVASAYENGHIHFMEMSHGRINATELVAALINQKSTLVEGLLYAQEKIEGSMSILLLTPEGIYASRDKFGRTPIVIGHKDDAYCASFESFAYINLGYTDYKELGPGEIVYMTPESVETVSPPREEMKICSFLWVYYGYPTSSYEGINVESMRYECGKLLAKRDDAQPEVGVSLPRVAWDREYPGLREKLEQVRALGVKDALLGNLGMFPIARELGFTLRGDFGLEIYNAQALKEYKRLGLQSATLSFELKLAQIRDLSKCLDTELITYGRLPLMLMENCIIRNRTGSCGCQNTNILTDRKGARFPVVSAPGCRNELLNSQKLFLADRAADYRRIGLWAQRLLFTTENPRECVQVAQRYLEQGSWTPNEYTRGLYYRDVE